MSERRDQDVASATRSSPGVGSAGWLAARRRRQCASGLCGASTSQPDCVAHVTAGEGAAERGRFSAAQSSCYAPIEHRTRETDHDDRSRPLLPPLPTRTAGAHRSRPPMPFDWLRRAGATSRFSRRRASPTGAHFPDLGRHRRRPVCARPRLHPVSGVCRLHGGRPDPRRSDCMKRAGASRKACRCQLAQHVLRQAATRAARSCSPACCSVC